MATEVSEGSAYDEIEKRLSSGTQREQLSSREKGILAIVHRSKMRSKMNRDRVARLIADGKKPSIIAKETGLSPQAVTAVYDRAMTEYGAGTLTDDEADMMRAKIRNVIETVMDNAMEQLDVSPSYGALAIKSAEYLATAYNLHNSDGKDGHTVGAEEIAARARVVSPLLADKLQAARQRALKAVKQEATEVIEAEEVGNK